MRLTVSLGAALSERHLACSPQLLLYKDFIAGLKEGTEAPPISPARDGQKRADLYIAAAAVLVGIPDREGVEGVAESLFG